MIVNEVLALVLGYLLGSIPTAYIAARIVKGEDIRRLGGGNIGALNTLKAVGKIPAAIVLIVDLGKGAAAVAIAYWLLKVPAVFVILAGLMSVVGHLWMIFLKFSGGRGMGAMVGAIILLFAIYGRWLGLSIFLVLIVMPLVITRNIALSMAIAILWLPLITWFTTHSGVGTILSVVLGLLVGGKFLPTAKAAWAKSRNKREFVFGEKPPAKSQKDSQ